MSVSRQQQFIAYLKDELDLPAESIALALRHASKSAGQLHMILWQYGLITIQQLETIFDWLEASTPVTVVSGPLA